MAQPSSDGTVGSLMEAFSRINMEKVALQHENEKVQQHNVALRRQLEELRCSGAFYLKENESLAQMAAEKERRLEHYASMLALQSDAMDAYGGSRAECDYAAVKERLRVTAQRLARAEDEKEALRGHVDTVSRVCEEKLQLQTQLDAARSEANSALAEVEPSRTAADLWMKKYASTRDMLGKAEVDLQRATFDFQQKLQAMAQQLRSCKTQNEELTRQLLGVTKARQAPPGPSSSLCRPMVPAGFGNAQSQSGLRF